MSYGRYVIHRAVKRFQYILPPVAICGCVGYWVNRTLRESEQSEVPIAGAKMEFNVALADDSDQYAALIHRDNLLALDTETNLHHALNQSRVRAPSDTPVRVVGLVTGENGRSAVQHIIETYDDTIANLIWRRKGDGTSNNNTIPWNGQHLGSLHTRAVAKMEHDFMTKWRRNNDDNEDNDDNDKKKKNNDGASIVLATLVSSKNGHEFSVTNVGSNCCVACFRDHSGAMHAQHIAKTHVPDHPQEVQRIQANNGLVTPLADTPTEWYDRPQRVVVQKDGAVGDRYISSTPRGVGYGVLKHANIVSADTESSFGTTDRHALALILAHRSFFERVPVDEACRIVFEEHKERDAAAASRHLSDLYLASKPQSYRPANVRPRPSAVVAYADWVQHLPSPSPEKR